MQLGPPPDLPDLGYVATMPNQLRWAAERFGERPFVVLDGRMVTYAEVERRSAMIARRLLALGLQKGGRVGIMLPNTPEWALLFFAITRAGGVAVLMSTLYKPREMREVAAQTDIDTLIIPDEYLGHDYVARAEEAFGLAGQTGDRPLFLPAAPHLRRLFVIGKSRPGWSTGGLAELETAPAAPDQAVLRRIEDAVSPADHFLVINTSGTTAAPKSVLHNHGAVVRLCYVLSQRRRYRLHDRMWNSSPFFWLGGLNVGLFSIMHTGMAYHVGTQKEAKEILDYVKDHEINFVQAWPWEAAAVRKHPEYPAYRERMPQLWRGFEPHLKEADGTQVPETRFPSGFGMTETFGPYLGETDGTPLPVDKAGSYGRAYEAVELKVVDPETGRELPRGEEGELLVRCFGAMVGYVKRERFEAFTPDGWFPTGDRCRVDAEGWMFTSGRLNDLLKIRGANVAPREVEMVLQARPEIQEAAVLAVPDGNGIDRLIAVILAVPGHEVSEAALHDYCRRELSSYKVPSRILVRAPAEIPRTVSNKVNKRLLRDDLLQRELKV
jgi:acyl-CoA synthetase (AMP-forming)/AMP-acid ligase II